MNLRSINASDRLTANGNADLNFMNSCHVYKRLYRFDRRFLRRLYLDQWNVAVRRGSGESGERGRAEGRPVHVGTSGMIYALSYLLNRPSVDSITSLRRKQKGRTYDVTCYV
ncbi:hypothetical protein EVAR_75067_1 [Eumeta japonica]|uniref:Uncharacterized protein n=1 Tax=Eumeta variegata TaxID=151549 RepID=A0A4C1W190_EUMVA|nr:hypothetical protein EVAR_75067_1 [Eumeta japonica]